MFITIMARKNAGASTHQYRINLSAVESLNNLDGPVHFRQSNGDRLRGPAVEITMTSGTIYIASGTAEIIEARL